MRSLISYLILPLPIFFFFISITAFLILFKKKKTSLYFAILSLIWLLIISTSTIPNLLIKSLENQYQPILEAKQFDNDSLINIMVLGGGHTNDKRLPYNNQLPINALGRLIEGIRLHRMLPNSKLIVSGWAGNEPITQAEVLAKTAYSLGVDTTEIVLLKEPKTTNEESKEYAKKFGKFQKLIIITDAAHIPRAMKFFHKQGINPIPSPTNHVLKMKSNSSFIEFLPSANNISKFEYATHEYIGMLWSYIEN